jgi:hypothetical protein
MSKISSEVTILKKEKEFLFWTVNIHLQKSEHAKVSTGNEHS